jgi:putative ABC transport system permease protein
MRKARRLLARVKALFLQRRMDADFGAELDAHLALMQEELARKGLSPAEARREARRKIGGVDQARQLHHDARTLAWIESFFQDVRLALRMLRKNPGFAAVAILTLAIGIGANTAIFSAVNGIVLKPLPYADASRLVEVMGVRFFPGNIEASTTFSANVWQQVREQTPAIAQMALYQNLKQMTLTGNGVPEIVASAGVSSDFFSVLGSQPLLGRPILAGDTQPGSKAVAVVSYDLWRDTWSGEPSLIGRTVTLDGKSYEVIGVMPPDCKFPLQGSGKGVWLPFLAPVNAAEEQASDGMMLARLKPKVSIEAANEQLKTVSSRLASDFTGFLSGGRFQATGLKRRFGDLDKEMLVLLGAVGFVLLISCVNVSGLLLARGWARQREVAIREALGASRLRIVRQLLTESVMLALAGGAVGLLFSIWGVHVLRAITPSDVQQAGQFRIDTRVLWFTAVVSLVTGILFGLAPAVQASARKIGVTLKENMNGSQGAYSARRTAKLRNALAAFEIAMAVVLVIGATLATRSFQKLASVRLGFRTDHVVTMTANFSKSVCAEGTDVSLATCWPAVEATLTDVRTVPGVQNAAVVSTLPLASWAVVANVQIEGQLRQLTLGNDDVIADRIITPDYFRALDMHFLMGRQFLDTDTTNGNHVAIVDDLFASKYLGNRALGQRISFRHDADGKPRWMEIVGVVLSAHDLRAGQEPRPEIYVPFAQAVDFQGARFIVRSVENPALLIPAIERAIWSVEKDTPITEVATMDQVVEAAVAAPKYQTVLLAAFGAIGLLLAMVGVYGVISYGVSQRTHEIGVRIALGAHRGNILLMVVGEGMLFAMVGIAAGAAAAMGLGRFLQSLLFEVKPTDPATFIGVAVALALVAFAACYVPARRAMRVDPMVALRHE